MNLEEVISSVFKFKQSVTLKYLGKLGLEAEQGTTSEKGYVAVEFSHPDCEPEDTIVALCAKEFSGEVTKKTIIILGENEDGDTRFYLTNNSGELKGKKKIKI
jgi:hypothetical protein